MTKYQEKEIKKMESYFEVERYGSEDEDKLSHEMEFCGFIVLDESALSKYASDEDWGTQIEDDIDEFDIEEEDVEEEE